MPINPDAGSATASLNVESSGVQRGVNQAVGALSALEPVVRDNWWGLRNLGLAFAGIGGAVAATFAVAGRAAIQWESALAGVERTTYDASLTTQQNQDAVANLGNELQDLAARIPTAPTALAKIAEEAGALGISSENIAGFTEVIAQLEATTDLTADEATKNLARIAGVLDVPADQFKNLGSAILETGRSTAATEPEIVNFARRLSGAGAAAGLSADEVVGISAAVISLGPRAEAGSTAVQKTLFDMATAIAENGDQLKLFAAVAGVGVEEFARLFRDDAAEAFTRFTEGLGTISGDAIKTNAVLAQLGITEVRQVQALAQLGAASQGTSEAGIRLRDSLAIANDAFEDGNALQDVAARRFATTAARIEILRNMFTEVKQGIGALFLPAINAAIFVMQSFAAGVTNLSGTGRAMVAVLVAIVGGMAALGAGALLLIPRIVLVRQSLRELQIQAGITAASTQLAFAGMSAAATASGAGLARYIGVATRMAKVGGILTGVLAIVGTGLTIHGATAGRAAKGVQDLTKADQELVSALSQVGGAAVDATNKIIAQRLAQAGAVRQAERLGVSLDTINRIIQGTATTPEATNFVKVLQAAEKQGDKSARRLGDTVTGLFRSFQKSRQEANATTKANKALGVSADEASTAYGGLAKSTKDATAAQREARQAIIEQNQARIALIDAMFGEREARLAVADAQDAYAEAVSEAANPVKALRKYENDLAKARIALERALIDLADAEEKLSTARADAAEELADAEDRLADARDKYVDSLEDIRKAEERLAKLREGPSAERMRKATLRLRDAQLSLYESERYLLDAEWQLSYLRQEGASDRDIADAEHALERARYGVDKANEDLTDAENELREAREGPTAEEIADAERDLAKAYRDSRSAARDIVEQEREVAQQRRDIASDRAYREALLDLRDAQLAVEDAQNDLAKSARDLQKAQDGGSARDLARAELELEQALYRQAKASVEVTKQQALARGEFFSSAMEAQELARQLGLLSDKLPSREAIGRFKEMARILREAREEGPEPKDAEPVDPTGGFGPRGVPAPSGDNAARIRAEMKKLQDEAKKSPGIIERILSTGFAIAGGLAVRALFKAIISKFAVGAVAGVLGGPIGILVGIAVSLLIDKFLQSEVGQKIVEGIANGIRAAGSFFADIGRWLWENIVGPILRFFGIGSPAKAMMPIGTDIILGLLEGILSTYGRIANTLLGFYTRVIGFFARAGLWLLRAGGDILVGLLNGILGAFGHIGGVLNSIYTRVIGFFINAARWLFNVGSDILVGLLNGLIGAFGFIGGVLQDIYTRVTGFFANATRWLFNLGSDVLVGLLNGIYNAFQFIHKVFMDVYDRVTGFFGKAGDWLFNTGRNILIGLWNGIASFGGEFGRLIVELMKNVIPGPIKRFFGISSPSKLMKGFGLNIGQGLAVGILDSKKEIEKAARAAADAADPRTAMAANSLLNTAPFDPFRGGAAANPSGGTTINNYNDHLELEAITTADPNEIVGTYMFQKRVRTRQ